MASGGSLIRVMVQLGIVMLLANLIFTGPTIASLNVPTYVNPFDTQVQTFTLYASDNSLPFSAPTVGCANWTYYKCLQTNDGNLSYMSLQFVNAANNCYTNGSNPPDRCGDAVFNLFGSIPSKAIIQESTLIISCRATSSVLASFSVYLRTLTDNQVHTCPQSNSSFVTISFPLSTIVNVTEPSTPFCYWSDIFQYVASNNAGACAIDTDPSHHPGIQTEIRVCGITGTCSSGWDSSGPFDISYVALQVVSSQVQPTCAGTFDMGCQIGRFTDTVVKLFRAFINAVSFIFSLMGSFYTILFSVFANFIWLYSIPGLPSVIQITLNIYITAHLFYLIYVLVSLVRGIGAGA